MSAFVVNHEHLGFLVACLNSTFRDGKVSVSDTYLVWHRGSEVALATLAGILHAENVRSVNFRYRENNEPESIAIDWRKVNAKRNRLYSTGGRRAVARAALMAISCLDYQSCETPDWPDTDAAKLLGRIAVAVAHDAAEENSEWEMTF